MQQLNNPFDYAEYIQLCKKNNILQVQWFEYAHRVNMLNVAIAHYPSNSTIDAYNLMATDTINFIHRGDFANTSMDKSCSSCGGGTVK